jgi:hypothetical protein
MKRILLRERYVGQQGKKNKALDFHIQGFRWIGDSPMILSRMIFKWRGMIYCRKSRNPVMVFP